MNWIRTIIPMMFFSVSSWAGLQVEVDPLAYAFQGYSVHVSYLTKAGINIDLGAFGMTMPDGFSSQKDYQTKFTGYGIKIQYFPNKTQGIFVGLEGGTSRISVTEKISHEEKSADVTSYGIQIGYRYNIGQLYILPWIGLDFPTEELKLKTTNSTYEHEKVIVFPTVHLGYSF